MMTTGAPVRSIGGAGEVRDVRPYSRGSPCSRHSGLSGKARHFEATHLPPSPKKTCRIEKTGYITGGMMRGVYCPREKSGILWRRGGS